MPLTTAGKNVALDALAITHAALFDGDPAGAGSECAGGGYARQAITLGAASGGVRTASNQPIFNVPSGFTVAWLGFHTAVTGGTLLATHDNPDLVFGAPGTVTITSASITAT